MTEAILIVEARLAAAVVVIRSIPSSADVLQIDVTDWPGCVLETLDAARLDQTARRAVPTEEALDDMRAAIAWLGHLEPEEAELVWLRASGQPWRYVSQKTGCVRPKAWSRWKAAIAKIARRAKVRAKASPPKPKTQAASKKEGTGEPTSVVDPLPLFGAPGSGGGPLPPSPLSAPPQ